MVDPEPTASGDDLDFTDASLLRAAAAAPARALPPKAPGPGTRIGDRFVARRMLGRGGMGVVVLAEDTRLHREVAVKLSGIDPFGATAGRMRREAQAMARLDDANVLEVYDVGEHEGALFIAMEYAPGGSLRLWLDRGPHPWPAVLDVFVAAGRGLAAAHAHGIVHRDFKPDNVLFDASGRPRVADFGLARAADDDSSSGLPLDSLTATGVALGTPAYMPLEQYGGPVDARADQFAFCVALWEGIFGERPFAGESAAQLLLSISEGRIRAMPPGREVPAAIEAALRRGLAARPADRFGSMAILVGALRRAARRRAVPRGAIVGAVALAL